MIGIRREDKSRWERRVPLVPRDLARLRREEAIDFRVETSPTRVVPDDEYLHAGAEIVADLAGCSVILGVKEIPPERLQAETTYVCFAHVIKGQPANMPLLRRLLELNCQLIDYERITDEQGRRLVLFGRFAGLAGMVDSLWALGRRLGHEGIDTPLRRVEPAHRYTDLADIRREIAAVGDEIRRDGLPPAVRPLVCGFAGYGHVSRGAQEIYDLLPVEEVAPADLPAVPPAANVVYKVVFREEHLVRPADPSAPFRLQQYYDRPELYRAAFFPYLEQLTLLVNCIYWEPRYPRLVARDALRELYAGPAPRLRVIGDITCDVDGALACTVRATTPDRPVYVYDPRSGEAHDGFAGRGPVVLAIDFLPAELPLDASVHFSGTLSPFVPALARANFDGALADSGLPPELQRATIVHRGALTEPYRYLEEHLRR